jgi:ABC-type multidrug transport system fused ATPase/permease subunit
MSSPNKDEEEQKRDIIQPSASTRSRFMFEDGKAKLDHPRNLLWRWLFSYLTPFKLKFILFFTFLVISTVITSYMPIIAANIIDDGIIKGDVQYIYWTTIIYLFLVIILVLSNYISQFGMGKISQFVTYDIRKDLFLKLQKIPLGYYDKRSSGDIMSIMTNDVTQLNLLVGGQFVQIITSIISIGLSVLFMFILNPILALISLIIFPLFYVIIRYFRSVATRLFKESRRTLGRITSTIQENIAGAKIVRAYGQEGRASKEFDDANTANYKAMLNIRKQIGTIMPLFTFMTTLITAGIIYLGGIFIFGNITIFGISVSVGVLSAFITILAQFFRPFMAIMQIQQVIESALAASDRIYTVLEEKAEISEISNPLTFSYNQGKIVFSSVSFGYRILESDFKKDILNGSMITTIDIILIDLIKSKEFFPDPYFSFITENLNNIPQAIKSKLLYNLLKDNTSEIEKTIDKVFSDYKIAVPETNFAKSHPEYITNLSFEKLKINDASKNAFSEEEITQLINIVQRLIDSKTSMQEMTSSNIQTGETVMKQKQSFNYPRFILQFLASISIPEDLYSQLPKIITDAISEQEKLLKHKMSTGYVLRDLSLIITPGTTLAIVGETGAGKTTLIKLIARFYDVINGTILIDDIDIRKIRKKDLRNSLGIVPQDSFLFTGTIKENLLYAFDKVTPDLEKKMVEISKFLGLHNFIQALNKKYDTRLKENGSNISIGQRQLIAFARALLKDPKILILDEATSSVDPYTETLIQDALNLARRGRTTLIIAHRLSTIRNANKIIVLSANAKGIVEEGTHEDLIALNGKYKRLLDMQDKEVDQNV